MLQRFNRRIVAGAVAMSMLVTACHRAGVIDKAGGGVVVLRFATIDTLNSNAQSVAPNTFISAVKRLSGDRMRVVVKSVYEDGAATAETDLVKAIAVGDLDGGWPNTRAFSRAGIRGLEAIEAPMTLTNYAAERALASGPASKALLKTLAGSGVVGLGLTVGPLRRPWALKHALVDPQSWKGLTFRSYNSPVEDETIRALGATPVTASFDFPDLVQASTLQGVETDVGQYAMNGYGGLLPWAVGNEVLWPRMPVLSLSQARFDSLTAAQRGWVEEAANQAVQASIDFDYDEAGPAMQLCVMGVRFLLATPTQLAALRRAVQPVLDALSRDPATEAVFAVVKRVASGYGWVDGVDVLNGCRHP
jgi:TRAP-type C4-dicarboxylate transport system substrate-binding protein